MNWKRRKTDPGGDRSTHCSQHKSGPHARASTSWPFVPSVVDGFSSPSCEATNPAVASILHTASLADEAHSEDIEIYALFRKNCRRRSFSSSHRRPARGGQEFSRRSRFRQAAEKPFR